MSAMSELSITVEELRTAARALNSAADSLMQLFSSPEGTQPAETPKKPLTLEEVRVVLSDKCAHGFGSQVKALIEDYGVKSLKEIDPQNYEDLVLSAQALGQEEEPTDA